MARIDRIEELALESSQLSTSVAQTLKEVVIPAIKENKQVWDEIAAIKARQSEIDGAIKLMKAVGAILAAAGIIAEILNITGVI